MAKKGGGLTTWLLVGGGVAVAYFSDCFGFCSGFRATVEDFIAGILPPGDAEPEESYHTGHTYVTRPNPQMYKGSALEIQQQLPSDWDGHTIDPVIHPVMAGKDNVGIRNARNLGLGMMPRPPPRTNFGKGGYGGMGY